MTELRSDPRPEASPPGAIARRVAGWVGWMTLRRSRSAAVLALVVAIGVAATWFGTSIRVDTDLRRLLPKSAPTVAALDLLQDRKGTAESFVIAIEAPTSADAEAMARGLDEELASWSETISHSMERDYTPLRNHALYMMELGELEQLRDELQTERRRAIARAMGPGLVEGKIDTDAVMAGDDWDSGDGDMDWGAPEDPEAHDPAPAELAEPAAEEAEDKNIDEVLRGQREKLIAQGKLSAEEVALIWPQENDQGEVEWHERIGKPYSNSDGRIRTIHANLSKPATDVSFAQDVVARVEERAEALREEGVDPETRVQVVAAYKVAEPLNRILRDAKRATWISGVLVIVVLLVGFRSLRILPLILVPMSVAMGMTLAVAKVTYGELNALTVFLFAVLFGMGVDFSVHLYALRERQGKQPDWPEVIRSHFRALAATMATTSASLLVLGVAEFKAFREFGIISGVGVALCFLTAIILVPATDVLLGPLRRGSAARGADPSSGLAPKLASGLGKARYVVLVLLAGVALYGAPQLEMEKDTRELNANDDENSVTDNEIAYRDTGGRYKSCALVADDPAELALVVDRMLAEQGQLLPNAIDTGEPRAPWIDEVFSLGTLMPIDQDKKAAVIAEIGVETKTLLAELPDLDDEARRYQTHIEALDRMTEADPVRVDELPDWSIEPFRERDGSSDRIAHLYLDIAVYNIDELVATRERLDVLLEGTSVRFADSRLVFADLMVDVEKDARRVPLIALFVILLFIAADLRRPLPTLACFSTLALGVFVAVAVMGLWPLKLNFFNLVVMPGVVGLGIDASIHLWHARDKDTLAATGKASLLAAMTTVAGFSGLLAAEHAGLRSIGEVGVMAILVCVGIAFLALYPLRRSPL